MDITRRQLLVLAVIGASGGCATESSSGPANALAEAPADAGPLTHYSTDTIYADFRNSHGFFIIRANGKLFAQSAYCTHRHCKIDATGSGFECPCHGATFTAVGTVTGGPARHNLARFAVEVDTNGHLIVRRDLPALGREELESVRGFISVGHEP